MYLPKKPRKLREKRPGVGPSQALSLCRQFLDDDFTQSMNVFVQTSISPNQWKQRIRGVSYPLNGLQQTSRIIVFSSLPEIIDELSSNTDVVHVGGEELIRKLADEEIQIDFTHAFCTEEIITELYNSLKDTLEDKFLLPHARFDSVVNIDDITIDDILKDLRQRIEAAVKGTIRLQNDQDGALWFSIGNMSLTDRELFENLSTTLRRLYECKPYVLKREFLLHHFPT